VIILRTEGIMVAALGSLLVPVLFIFVGVFLTIAAYSRNPVLLRIASVGTVKIDPDSPGKTQRAIVFSTGIGLILVGVVLVVLDRLHGMGLL
jgi:hypothetical protein